MATQDSAAVNDEAANGDLVTGDSTLMKIATWLTDCAVNGIGPLSSSAKLAEKYKIDTDYPDDDERVDSLINWETTRNFATGFITGLGGFVTLPVTVPAGLAAAWAVQARMVGAIAEIYGYSINDKRTQTAVLLSLVGSEAVEVLKSAGVKIGTRFTENLIAQIPGRMLIEINKKVGMRLLTKAGEKGIINLSKLVPIIGAPISGGFDAAMCRTVGKVAKAAFRPEKGKTD